MNKAKNRIFNLVLEKEYLNKVARSLKKSPIEAYKRILRLEPNGYVFNRTYYDNGQIKFSLHNKLKKPLMHTACLKLTKQNEFKFAVVSDIHDGHRLSDIRLADTVYEHCMQNDIHVILNTGDIIDGSCGDVTQRNIISPQDQLEHFITEYPYDRTILNFITLGDHEKKTLEQTGLDTAKFLESSRPDLIPMGYGLGILNFDNAQLLMEHKGCGIAYPLLSNNITLSGHSHAFAYDFKDNGLMIKVPSLSYLLYDRVPKPRFLEVTLLFDNDGHFNNIHLRSLSIEDGEISINADIQTELNFMKYKNINENNLGLYYSHSDIKAKKHRRTHHK